MNEYTLDLSLVKSEEDFHDLVASVMGFPHYYGRNPDAFWDCLTDFVEPTKVYMLNINMTCNHSWIAAYIDMMHEYEAKTKGRFSIIFEVEH